MNHYQADSFQKVSDLLEASCMRYGANGFSIGDEVLPLSLALDESGLVSWALIMHAEALVKQTGVGSQNSTNTLPFTAVVNNDAPFGNQAIIQPGLLPLSVAYSFLDAAVEHCICLGLQHYNYSPSAWDQLSDGEKVIPIEPYYNDLKENWLNDVSESGSDAERLAAWPTLLTIKSLNSLTSDQSMTSQVLSFPSAR